MITINILKNKTINSTNNIEKNMNVNDYMSLSPSLIPKKNIISNNNPTNDIDINNNMQTDLDKLISFSPAQIDKKNILNEYLLNNNNQNSIRNIIDDDNENSLYEKKLKKNIKRKKSENNLKNISFEKKNIKEKLINSKTKTELFGDTLNKEENKSKIKNEIDINTNKEQILRKTKSSSKLNPYLKYTSQYQNNYNNYTYKNGDNKLLNEESAENKIKNFIKETNKELSTSRNNKTKIIYGGFYFTKRNKKRMFSRNK